MNSTPAATYRFRAFVSYSHTDRGAGDWLHKALESYRIPKGLVGTETDSGVVPTRLFPVFRDREEMPASADLGSRLREALEASACLIVICSPRSANSRWVNEEILHFKKLGRSEQIYAVIVDGEPNSDDNRECFPPALKFKVGADGELTDDRSEPIAADARANGDGRDNALLKVIAGILGVGFDLLKQRELEAARRRVRIARAIAGAMAVLAVAALGAGTLAWLASTVARDRLDASLIAQSRATAEVTVRAKPEIAIPALLAVLPSSVSNPDRPYVPEVAARLAIALDLAHDATEVTPEPSQQIRSIRFPTGRPLLLSVSGQTRSTVALWSVPDGLSRFKREFTYGVRDADLSPDGETVAVAERDQGSPVALIRVQDGQQQKLWIPASSTSWSSAKAAAEASDGSLVVVSSEMLGGSITITAIHPVTGKVLDVAHEPCMDVFASNIAFPGASLLLLGCRNGRLALWGMGKTLRRIGDVEGVEGMFAFIDNPVSEKRIVSPSAKRIAADADGKLVLINLDDQRTTVRRPAEGRRVALLSFPNGSDELLAIFDDGDGAITMPDGTERELSREAAGVDLTLVERAALAGGGKHLLLALVDGTLELWSWQEWKRIAVIPAIDRNDKLTEISSAGATDEFVLAFKSGRVEKRRVGDAAVTANAQAMPDAQVIVSGSGGITYIGDGKRSLCAWQGSRGPTCIVFAGNIQTVWPMQAGDMVLVTLDSGPQLLGSADLGSHLAPTPPGASDVARFVRYSRSGKQIAVATFDNEIVLIDIDSGVAVFRSDPLKGDINEIAFDQNGRFIVVRLARQVAAFDLSAKSQRPLWTADVEGVSLAFRGDLLFVGTDRTTEAFAVSTGQLQPADTASRKRGSLQASASNGIALYQDNGAYALWTASGSEPVSRHVSGEALNFQSKVALSPDATVLALASQKSPTIRLRSADLAVKPITLSGLDPKDSVIAAAFMSDQDRVLLATKSGRAVWADAATGSTTAGPTCDCGGISAIFAGPRGTALIVGDTAILMLGEQPKRIVLPEKVFGIPLVDRELSKLVLASLNSVHLVDLNTGEITDLTKSPPGFLELPVGLGLMPQVAWMSADGARLAYVQSGALTVFDLTSKSARRVADLTANVANGAIDEHGQTLALAFDDNIFQVFDLDAGTLRYTARLAPFVGSLEFIDPDKILIHATETGGAIVSARRDQLLKKLDLFGSDLQVEAIAPVGNDRFVGVLSGLGQGQAIVWAGPNMDPARLLPLDRSDETWQLVAPLPRITVSADRRHALFYGHGKRANLLDLWVRTRQELLDEACRRIVRPLSPQERAVFGIADERPPSTVEQILSQLPLYIRRVLGVPPRAKPCERLG